LVNGYIEKEMVFDISILISLIMNMLFIRKFSLSHCILYFKNYILSHMSELGHYSISEQPLHWKYIDYWCL